VQLFWCRAVCYAGATPEEAAMSPDTLPPWYHAIVRSREARQERQQAREQAAQLRRQAQAQRAKP
jgi:hypothetical protein